MILCKSKVFRFVKLYKILDRLCALLLENFSCKNIHLNIEVQIKLMKVLSWNKNLSKRNKSSLKFESIVFIEQKWMSHYMIHDKGVFLINI
jgi:hypothetical protein